MHLLAKRLAEDLKETVSQEDWGGHVEYNSVYFGMLESEPVSIEEYIDGTFVKYIINNVLIFIDFTRLSHLLFYLRNNIFFALHNTFL